MSARSPGPMTATDVVRYSLVLFVVICAQHSLLDFVRLDNSHPDAVLLLPIAAGYVGGSQRGATVGFFTGLVADLFVTTTFGLSALLGCLLGSATGAATSGLVRSSRSLAVVTLTTASVAGLVGYAVVGAILGDPGMLSANLAPTLVVATPAAAVLALPVLALVRWSVPPALPAASVMPHGGSTR